jgi:putative nucleotidyltransferase with HDIG domain
MRKLEVNELEIGMITGAPIKTKLGQEIAPAGSPVTRQLINRLKLYHVESILIADSHPHNESGDTPAETAPAEPTPAEPKPAEPKPAKPVHEAKTYAEETRTHLQKVATSPEFQAFQFQYLMTIEQMKQSFTDALAHNHPINTELLLDSVSKLFCSRNTIVELFDMIFSMRRFSDTVYAHSLNVALISRMIGRWLKLDHHEWDILTLAGLLHDIGKLLIPQEILNKPDALTDEEFARVKQHPKLGYEFLKNQADLDPRIKKAALMHHERCDGSGYPSGLHEDLIDDFAMLVAIADVYDAMTAARTYREPLCPFQVISNFEQEGFQKYHTQYLLTFLQQIAATYQSNRVLLSNGHVCNIIMLNPSSLSRPIVQFDDKTCLDLSTSSRDIYIASIL